MKEEIFSRAFDFIQSSSPSNVFSDLSSSFQGCAYYSPSLHAKCNANQKWSVLERTGVCIPKKKRAKCELFIFVIEERMLRFILHSC